MIYNPRGKFVPVPPLGPNTHAEGTGACLSQAGGQDAGKMLCGDVRNSHQLGSKLACDLPFFPFQIHSQNGNGRVDVVHGSQAAPPRYRILQGTLAASPPAGRKPAGQGVLDLTAVSDPL